MRQLATRLLLDTEALDLGRVPLRGGDEALAAAVEEHDRRIEMIEQGRRRVRAQVREEQVEPLVVDARAEQIAVALPLLAYVVAQPAGIERR